MGMGEGPPRAGTRGGRDRFSWQDVKDDHRNAGHYLGASIKAPSGRWAANKDLEWFNKPAAGQGGSEIRADMVDAAAARREEVRRIKEAEEDAVLRALGMPVPDRTPNTNLEPLGVPSTVRAKNLQEETAAEKESSSRHPASRRRHRSRSREGSRRRSRSRNPDRRRRRSPSPRESSSRRSHHRSYRQSRSRSRSRSRDRHPRRS